MNETDNPRNERRRSSRGRRRRSGGGDRSSQQAPSGYAAEKKPAQPNLGPGRMNKKPRPNNDRRPGGKDLNARREEAPKGDRNNKQQKRPDRGDGFGKNAAPLPPRDRFSAQRVVSPPLPKPICPRCGSPIEDLPSALNDKENGAPIHFDCVLARISEGENLGEGEKIVYLGGGRFGVVLFENPGDLKRFRVKKTIQWEEKDKRADWRRQVTDLFSAT